MKNKRRHFVTCGQMRILERRADEEGLSYYQMMENAGRGAAKLIKEFVVYRNLALKEDLKRSDDIGVADSSMVGVPNDSPNNDALCALVFCGKGNNGGDGFVAARELYSSGYDVTVILVDGMPVTEDSIANFEILKSMSLKIKDMTKDKRALMEIKEVPDLIIDAVYGTGFHGKLCGNGLKIAIYINSMFERYEYRNKPIIIALDVPSGLAGDLTERKHMDENGVKAHYTLAFHAMKPVHLQKFAADHCGKVRVVDIGIDEQRLWNVEL